MSRIKFLNTYIDNVTMEEALEKISNMVESKQGGYVVTPNVDHLVTLEKDALFRRIYDEADLILADGKPLIWISKLLKTPIKEKISGSDLFPLLAEMAAEKGYTMFFLGAAEGVAAKAAENLKIKYPGLQVVDTYSPPYGFEDDEVELAYILDRVQEASPDILIVGLGAPKQEKFIYRYRERLKVPVALGLGASLDFEAGTVKRAPRWMSEHGLEWLYRMCKEPGRLVKRYVVDAVELLPLILRYRK
jgi:N-acetylglucosaminyldiphosphoundecaprenol N-acetyl-beta-D-mannosaminyltransferase